jgi:hypothetical protein
MFDGNSFIFLAIRTTSTPFLIWYTASCNSGDKYSVSNLAHSSFKQIPYYLEFKKRLFKHFFELKIRMRLIFQVLFFTIRKPRKHNFPRQTSGRAKRVVILRTGYCIYLQTFFL